MSVPRFDLYAAGHKGLRGCLVHTLLAVGRTDWTDEADATRAVAAARELIELCGAHLDAEERFLHPALEARRPGAAQPTATDHRAHVREMAGLAAALDSIAVGGAAHRAAAGAALYRRLALFAAENFAHMDVEETRNNEVLWAHYSDEELRGLQQQLVASTEPRLRDVFQRWMREALPPGDWARVEAGLRARA